MDDHSDCPIGSELVSVESYSAFEVKAKEDNQVSYHDAICNCLKGFGMLSNYNSNADTDVKDDSRSTKTTTPTCQASNPNKVMIFQKKALFLLKGLKIYNILVKRCRANSCTDNLGETSRNPDRHYNKKKLFVKIQ